MQLEPGIPPGESPCTRWNTSPTGWVTHTHSVPDTELKLPQGLPLSLDEFKPGQDWMRTSKHPSYWKLCDIWEGAAPLRVTASAIQ